MVWGQNKNQRSYGGGGSSSMGSYQGGGRGILGESPGGGMSSGGGYAGIQGLGGIGQSIIGNIGNDNIDTMMQQRRLQQQLSLRESQLALASNLLQKQSQLIMDVGLPGSGGGSMGPMLQSPNQMSRQMIPSLLDMPSNPRQGKRPGQMGRDLDFKRRRRDSSPSDQRGRHSDFDRRPRDRDRFSPVRRREDPPSRRDRPSRFNRVDSGEDRRRRRSSETYDPANPTADGEEMPDLELADEIVGVGIQPSATISGKSPFFCHVCGIECFTDKNFRSHMTSSRHRERMSDVLDVGDKGPQSQARMKAQEHLKRIERTRVGFCKLCDMDLSIPFLRHKLTTLHKKREMQVHKGCGWCGVKNFINFSQVLKHREKESHKQNAAKFGKRGTEDRERRDSREGRERRNESRTSSNRSREMVTVDSVGFEKDSSRKNRSSSRTSKSSKETDPMPELKFDAEVAVGQNYVIPVSGFFCKLCHKFYNTENAAKVTHCHSEPHFNLFKKAKIAAKAKAKALAEKAKPTSTSTPISDKTKPETEEADNTMAEMRKEEQMDEDNQKAAEGEETTEGQTEENEEGEKAQDNQENQEEATEDQEAPEADQEEAMDVAGAEELPQTEAEEQEASVVDGEQEAANGVAGEEEDPLTEEQEEEKLLEKNDNEENDVDDFPEADLALDDEECDDSVGIVDLAEDSAMKEEATEESKTEAEGVEEESGEPPAEAEAEDAEVVDVQPVATRGRGRGRARRGKRGKK